MKKLLYLIPLLWLLNSCFCDQPQDVYLPPIPDSLLKCIPYADNHTFFLQHNNGAEVNYSVTRNLTNETSFCEFCCDYVYHYEVLTVNLVPDYNLPAISFQLYSPDSIYYYLGMYTMQSNFEIPMAYDAPPAYANYALLDTFRCEGMEYYQVFAIKAYSYNNSSQVIYDSLYYNFSEGIIKLKTNYEEYYTLKP